MGGRGASAVHRGGGVGLVSTRLPFDINAENVFLQYGLKIGAGGDLISERPINPNDKRWIEINKADLIKWKRKVDETNRIVKQRYEKIRDMVKISLRVEKRKEIFEIQTFHLEQEGLRFMIGSKSHKEWEVGDKKYTAKEMWQKLYQYHGSDTFFVDKKELGRYLGK